MLSNRIGELLRSKLVPVWIAALSAVAGLGAFIVVRIEQAPSKTMIQRQLPVKVPPYASAFARGRVVTYQRSSLDGTKNIGEIFLPARVSCSSAFVILKVGSQQSLDQYVKRQAVTGTVNSVSVLLAIRTRYTVDLLLRVPRSVNTIIWKAGSTVLDRESGYHGYVPMSVLVTRIHRAPLRSEISYEHGTLTGISLLGSSPGPLTQSC
jgi:hypothetical protein